MNDTDLPPAGPDRLVPTTPEVPPQPAAALSPLPLVPGESARYKFPSIHPEGRKFIAIAAGAVLLAGPIFGLTTLAWLLAGLTIWVAAFFRDPVRITPVSPDILVSPADGLVSLIVNCTPPRQLAGPGGLGDGPVTRVSVFMSVFDVHVNRAPVAGQLSRVVYVPGKFLNADLDKASDENERQYFIIEAGNGERVAFTQIAGLVARRILRFVEEGASLKVGERIGLIRFGSRVDVYLPAGFVPEVLIGQRAVAGETVLARRRSGEMLVGSSQ
jgi:phosphatidylserine decarboxylase